MIRSRRIHPAATALLITSVLLAGCGGGSGSASGAATSTAASTASSGRPSGGAGGAFGGPGGFDAATLQKITACLSAAGISVPSFSARPIPTGTAGGARPTGLPSGGPPSGAPTGGQGGGPGGLFGSAAAQAALKACGITVPTGRPAPSAAATS
jgi:hypothetical protein